MAITIDQESRQRSRISIDINFAGNRYKTANHLFTFPSPTLETIDKNLYFLLKHSEQRLFERQYLMRPDYLSFDEYGTVSLAHMIMYVNTVPSLEDFDLHTVIVPSFSAVVEMLKDRFPIQKTDDLIEVNW
ncbi:MAG: hypothetical protein DRN27_07300 [Thermoplasmata archaeon]|nr:MAG: hypothetical protein DRN27_07300 [Thermoplasmata archaeon]